MSCSGEQGGAEKSPYELPGPFSVGHETIELDNGAGRSIQVEVWYPTQRPHKQTEQAENYLVESQRAAYAALLAEAPADCPTRELPALRGAAPLAEPGERLPLVLFSHCVSCIKLSGASLAIRLASHGFAVAAPDHAGDLPFHEDSSGEPLDTDQLAQRTEDLTLVLDSLLAEPPSSALPEPLRGLFDGSRVGVMGHSFGSVTAGNFAQADSRVRAIAGLAAPLENPLLPGVSIDAITQPVFFLIAQEDNSITEIGNSFIRSNFNKLKGQAVEVELIDAGHWSMSDLCGVVPAFQPGCGKGIRHSAGNHGNEFSYAPVSSVMDLSQSYITAFFRAHLSEDDEAAVFLQKPRAGSLVRAKGYE